MKLDNRVSTQPHSYQHLLDDDTLPVPDTLRRRGDAEDGPLDVPISVYLDRAIHELEKERLWSRTWQMACRLDDLAEVGDTWVYDICDKSILLVRSDEHTIRAYYNSCLHRGRPLVDQPGRVAALKCPFHGFTWNLAGAIKHIPCRADFPQIDEDNFDLPQVRVDFWGGFVFVNLDPDAEPLSQYLGELSRHFERWPLDDYVKTGHAAKICPVNWKVAQEAFMEGLHIFTVHPQFMNVMDERCNQQDAFGNFARGISTMGPESEYVVREPTSEERLRAFAGVLEDEPLAFPLPPENVPFRSALAATVRDVYRGLWGDGVDELCDSEMVDALYYNVFPNFHPWGGVAFPYIYNFKPYGDDHTKCIFEILMLMPAPPDGDRPAPAPIHWLGENDSILQATELGLLAAIAEQDFSNFTQYSKGLTSSKRGKVSFSVEQELKIRHFYRLWSKTLGIDLNEGHVE